MSNSSQFPKYDWCGTTSIYLAFTAPNSYFNSSDVIDQTTPTLTSEDPQESLMRILVPSILLPVTLVMFFLGRQYFKTLFTIVGAGIGAAVAYGIVYGRPQFVPIETGCGAQWGATIGGAVIGLLVGFLIAKFFSKIIAFMIGGLLSFAIFQQYPQIDLLVTGFPALDDFNVLFLGWGLWPMWSITVIASLVTFIIFCFGKLMYWRKVFFISVCGSWSIAQCIQLISRNRTTLDADTSIGGSAAIFAGAFVIFVILQPVFDTVSCFRTAKPSNIFPANTVHMVGR